MSIRQRPADEFADDEPAAQRRRIENYHWPSTLPYYQPSPMRCESFNIGLTYAKKVDSPIMQIRVGPERKSFAVHKAMLTEAAEYFSNMFDGAFVEAREGSAEFPEDDPDAWEALVEWAYKGELPSLGKPTPETRFDGDATKGCWTRLKLCCLAEKYQMLLLHNLAIDSIIAFLRHGAPGPKLTWEVFETWCRYVYENTSVSEECGGLRKFISTFFSFSLHFSAAYTFPLNPNVCHDHFTNNMSDLACDIPDLSRDLFLEIRVNGDQHYAPWDCSSCRFHLHTGDIYKLECPASLNDLVELTRDDLESDVRYYLQSMALKGIFVCGVSPVANELGMPLQDVRSAFDYLVEEEK